MLVFGYKIQPKKTTIENRTFCRISFGRHKKSSGKASFWLHLHLVILQTLLSKVSYNWLQKPTENIPTMLLFGSKKKQKTQMGTIC